MVHHFLYFSQPKEYLSSFFKIQTSQLLSTFYPMVAIPIGSICFLDMYWLFFEMVFLTTWTNVSSNHENTKDNVALKNWSVLFVMSSSLWGCLVSSLLFDYMHTLIKIERDRCHDFNLGLLSKN